MMDGIELVIGFALLGVVCLYLIVPWLNRARIQRLETEVRALKAELRVLAGNSRPADVAFKVHEAPEPAHEPPLEEESAPWVDKIFEPPSPPQSAMPEAQIAIRKHAGFERQLGGRLAVWAGGVALALAGFFLVKYSIKIGLLTPEVRVLLGSVFGLGLLQAGRMAGPSRMADGARIGQALVGAGIASLYASAYTATSVYQLVPSLEGFLAMAAITAMAVVLSLRHGAPIAVLGMLGGFLTPALISSRDPSAALLFSYLLFLTAGLLAVLSHRGWWRIAAIAMVAAYGWAALWVGSGDFHSGDGVWLDLYLFGIAGCAAWYARALPVLASSRDAWAAKYLPGASAIATVLLGGWIVSVEIFDLSSIVLFWLLSAGGIVLAVKDQGRYYAVPFVSGAWGAILVVIWGWCPIGFSCAQPAPERIAEVALAFAILHTASGHILMGRARKPVPWAALAASSAIAYYLAAWLRLHETAAQSSFPVWGAIAMALALAAIEATREVAARFDPANPDKPRLLAIGAGAATAFISLGLTIEMRHDFLPVAVAGEVLALGWISSRIGWKVLRWYGAALTLLFAALMLPQFVLLLEIVVFSVTESIPDIGVHIAFAERPLFQLGLPALVFAGAAIAFRKQADDWLVKTLEVLSAALFGLSAYYLTRHLFHAQVLFAPASFLERGVNTNVLFLIGLACLWLGRHYDRAMVSRTGLALAGIALFRILYFDLLLRNPLWSPEFVGKLALVNWLLLPYFLPILWIRILGRQLAAAGWHHVVPALKIFSLFLAFTFVSLTVRQIFHGGLLNGARASNGEVYAYSAAWLLLGLGLLFAGTLKRARMLRIASLLVMLLTIGKVFLYDADQLDGLWRVFSFLALGLSLLGLSWFYSRFVFTAEPDDQPTAS